MVIFGMDTRARTHNLTLTRVLLMGLHMKDILETPWE